MKYILLLTTFVLCSSTLLSQSKVIEQLKEEEKVLTAYYLYPSTLRMINIQRDTAFDQLVKPIRRLSLLSMDDQKFDLKDLRHSAAKMIDEEAYETYAEMSGPNQNVFVLGKESKDFTCIIAQLDSAFYIVEMEGKVDILKLSKIYSSISQQDTSANAAFIDVFNLIGQDNKRKRKRQDWEKRTAEKRERNRKEAAMKRDSLEAVQQEQEIEQQL